MADECRFGANGASTRSGPLSTCDLLIHDVNVATMEPATEPYGAIRDGVVAVHGDRIAWVGPASGAPPDVVSEPAGRVDGRGGWVTPGLIDGHTHAVFGGTRARELERRLAGATYEEIAREGGGILSTVEATRAASDDTLFGAAAARLAALMAGGVTTVEIKSGYGLDVETELRMLAVARRLGDALPLSVTTTLLGAHTVPADRRDDRAGYLDLVCSEMIPRAATAGLADAVDVFCEGIAFSPEESARVLTTGAEHGLPGRVHADQLSDTGGAALAAAHGARSADHLEHTSEAGVRAMADAGTTAVLLPGAYYFLGQGPKPPIDAFRAHGVPMAVATDLNPGSSPLPSLLVAMNMACVLFGLTPDEALTGVTRAAAPVLGLGHDRGVLRAGLRADLAVWAVSHPSELAYWIGSAPCAVTVVGGRLREGPHP